MLRIRWISCLFIVFFQISSFSAVWTETQSWGPEWESKFSKWVEQHWQVDFFSRAQLPDGSANPYYGLTKDCADVVYSMRLVFSYENKLPFVMNDPTGGSRLITNRMSQFDRITNSTKKIRAFMEYIDSMVSTRTMHLDTYPIAINRRAVRPGSVILTTKVNHHSWTVKQILPIGVPWLVYNSVAGAGTGPHLKERQSWPNPFWVFEGQHSVSGYAGFRDWKPVDMVTLPQWQIPGYSEEQYKTPLNRWNKWAQQRLATRAETNDQMIQRLTKTACDGLALRVDAINEGVQYLAKNSNRCMNYENYDLYSTPSRDQRLFDDLMSLRQAFKDIKAANEHHSLDEKILRQMTKVFPRIERSLREELASQTQPLNVDADSLCPVNYGSNRSMDLAEAKRRISLALFSNNPHDGWEYRWGELKGPSPLANRCQAWDQWTPDLESH